MISLSGILTTRPHHLNTLQRFIQRSSDSVVNSRKFQHTRIFDTYRILMLVYRTAIAHCIREQDQAYEKSLFLISHPTHGAAIQDDALRASFVPSLTSGARAVDQVQSFTPFLSGLSDGELERHEKD